jgi:nudix-type nucleoside diphosphatase (YffH/AdpP family)
MMSYKILKVTPIYSGWGRYLIARVRLQDGTLAQRQIDDHGVAVAVLPYDPVRKVATLVRQPRTSALYASGQADILEAPAGRMDHPNNPTAEAVREAKEETGLQLGELEHVVDAWASPEVSTERVSLYLSRFDENDRVDAGGGLKEEDEAVTVVELPLSRLARLADAGQLVDMKTMLLLQTLRLWHPELFS